MVRIGGVDPESVEVRMDARPAARDERATAVRGVVERDAAHPEALVVVRIHPHLAEVHGARVRGGHSLPALAAVLGAEETAARVLDQGVKDARILAVDVQADAARIPGRQTARKLLPGS